MHLSAMTWVYLDVLVVALATILTYRVVLRDDPRFAWVVAPELSGTTFCVCIVVAGLVFGLYERATLGARSRIIVRCLCTLATGLALAYATISFLFYAEITRWLAASVALAYLLVAIPLRILAHNVIASVRVNTLCIGGGESIQKLVGMLRRSRRPHYHVVGRLDQRDTRSAINNPSAAFDRLCPRLGGVGDISRVLDQQAIDEVVVDAALTQDAAVGDAVLACLEQRCRVTDQPGFVERHVGEVPAASITPQWFLFADVQSTGGYDAVKRLMDIVVSLIGLTLTLAGWPVIACLIRLSDAGPAIYKQRRIGLHGREFTIYKFRTMRSDAEVGGARWADAADPRVTGIGRILRKTRLDELPQLWNILRGDMSLVGPRPERPEFVELLCKRVPHYRQRHLVKPGLTGWAQIHYGYGASVEDSHRKLCFDLYYLKHRSIDLDTAILIRTLGRFVLGAR